MKYLWAEWDRLKRKALKKSSRLLFLDFDGTLAPIANDPSAVRMDKTTGSVLKELSHSPRTHVIVISGRPIKELRRHIRDREVVLAGNHGLEMGGDGVKLPPKAAAARKLKNLINLLAGKCSVAFSYPGVWVENKRFTFSIHFRNMPESQYPVFQELLRYFKQKYRDYPLLWTTGKKVIEVRPSIYWGKAETVAYLLKKFPRASAIAVGDDKSDEDMFKLLNKKRGVTVRVGYSKLSSADYYLASPYDVKVFLRKLCP